MILAVRRGQTIRSVARNFGVSKTTVEHWLAHAKGKRLDRVDWNDKQKQQNTANNRTPTNVEACVLKLRKELKQTSPLGEHGADAIKREMASHQCKMLPSRATINRILQRNGQLDGKRRKRYPNPPTGWYLSPLVKQVAELDQFDYVEDLCILGGEMFNVLNGTTLHGKLVGSWPVNRMTAENTVQKLIEFWTEFGLPDYVQFDNSTVFQGSRWPDSLGRVTRLCLSLDVIPVFAPPRETGFQASIESYNGRWQRGVWQRFQFKNLLGVKKQSALYVDAVNEKNWDSYSASPTRWAIPPKWKLDYSKRPRGKVIFIRRTTDCECLDVMGHLWIVNGAGANKLVRAEVDLDENKIDFYALRRRTPHLHEHLGSAKYHFPNKPFNE